MKAHVKIELLSAYLDHALGPTQEHEIQAHLELCESCQSQFEGMRRVVSRLEHLERFALPPTLGQLVARRVDLGGESTRLLGRWESHRVHFERQSSLLGLFGLIVALGVLVLLFAHAVAMRETATIPVIFQDPATEASQEIELAGRVFLRGADGIWVEEGLSSSHNVPTIEIGSAEFYRLLDRHPELAELEAIGFHAVVRLEGRALHLESPPPSPQ